MLTVTEGTEETLDEREEGRDGSGGARVVSLPCDALDKFPPDIAVSILPTAQVAER